MTIKMGTARHVQPAFIMNNQGITKISQPNTAHIK